MLYISSREQVLNHIWFGRKGYQIAPWVEGGEVQGKVGLF